MVIRLTAIMFGIAVMGPASAANLRAYAGVVAGNAQGTGSIFACATSGPTIGNGWFAGLSLPTEGFTACNLNGGIDDQQGPSGPLTASQSATGPMATPGSTYTGSAQARANHWSLGVAANGAATGGTSSSTYHQSAAFASFTDTLTYQQPGIATGTAGWTNFAFLVEGIMNSSSTPPYTQQADVLLAIRVNGKFIWSSFQATLINEDLPYVRGGSAGLPGSFVSGPGSLSGSALVNSTANFEIQWGVPFTVEVALLSSVYPCCYGSSSSTDFANTAVLKGIDAYGPGGKVSDFTVITESGAVIGPSGLAAVPEPESWALVLGGLGIMTWWRRPRTAARPAR